MNNITKFWLLKNILSRAIDVFMNEGTVSGSSTSPVLYLIVTLETCI